MKKKIFLIIATMILVIGALTACGKEKQSGDKASAQTKETQESTPQEETTPQGETAAQEEADSQEKTTEATPLRFALAYDTNEVAGILKIAQDKGYLDQELGAVGYELEVNGFAQAGPAINEAFAADSIDIADYGNLPVTLAKAKGIGISEIGISNSKVDYAFLVKEDSDIKTLKDLEGKKVIIGVGTIIEQYWDRVVKEAGIDVSKVEIINDVATASTTFVSGNADVWITAVSYIDVLKKQNVNVRAIESTTDNHPEWAGETVFTVRDKFKEEHPEVVTAFLTAYYKAYQYALAHEEETYQYLSSTMLTAENAKKIYGAVTPLFSNFSGEITEEEKKKQEELIEFLLEKGYIDQKLEVTELVDTGFYEEAVKKAAENQ